MSAQQHFFFGAGAGGGAGVGAEAGVGAAWATAGRATANAAAQSNAFIMFSFGNAAGTNDGPKSRLRRRISRLLRAGNRLAGNWRQQGVIAPSVRAAGSARGI